MTYRLISLDYNVPSCDLRLDQLPLVLGCASDAGIRLHDRTVGNHHCRIERVDDELIVRDLGSVHGTFVNSCRVEESTLLPGDELSVGMLTFLLQAQSDIPAAGGLAAPASQARSIVDPARPTVAAL